MPSTLTLLQRDILSRISGLCPSRAIPQPIPTDSAFYVITCGRELGIFTDALVAKNLTDGVKGAAQKRYTSFPDAFDSWNAFLDRTFCTSFDPADPEAVLIPTRPNTPQATAPTGPNAPNTPQATAPTGPNAPVPTIPNAPQVNVHGESYFVVLEGAYPGVYSKVLDFAIAMADEGHAYTILGRERADAFFVKSYMEGNVHVSI
ncbi:hypothetical protein BD410DRAFT_847157 [Rickenella mellea]|uniref:Ribonuclease H1 N-terminal domain-containing protein n=1 Tax=Rickenella mellea TaxID=50990 RepID=A0A4Y7PDB9_9AGAM|nr:hypothetical protein BD410DRAFT_847157 [Rickenella mellea]